MPTIFAISGAEGSLKDQGSHEQGCKRVSMKSGCEILSCPKQSKKGRRVWRFKKGSMRCPGRGR